MDLANRLQALLLGGKGSFLLSHAHALRRELEDPEESLEVGEFQADRCLWLAHRTGILRVASPISMEKERLK